MMLAGSVPAQGVLDEAAFLVVDEKDIGIYAYDDSVQLVRFIFLDEDQNRNPSSVDFDDTFLYVLDRVDKRIYRYDAGGFAEGLSAELRRPDGGGLQSPTGLAMDGDDVWVVDRQLRRLFRYSLDLAFADADGDDFVDVQRVPALGEISLDRANNWARDLAMDSAWLYVVDDIARRVYRYARWGTGTVDVSDVMVQPGGESLKKPSGIAVSDLSAFIADYRYVAGHREGVQYEFGHKELFPLERILAAADEETALGAEPQNADPPEQAPRPTPAQGAKPLAQGNVDVAGEINKAVGAGLKADPNEPDELKGITDLHNIVRTKTPAAQQKDFPNPGLNKLVWDNALMAEAAKHAKSCLFQHSVGLEPGDKLKLFGVTEGAPGENLSSTGEYAAGPDDNNLKLVTTPKAKERAVIEAFVGPQGWATESIGYNHNGNALNHYTQLVWRETQKVGCALHPCTPLKRYELTLHNGK